MTREEAKEILLQSKMQCDYPHGAFGVALDIAIGALEQEPKTEWIPVKDDMPIVGEEVLVRDYDGDIYITYLHTDGKWGYDYNRDKIKNVIAWQPLPKPYESEG